jgi:hypothetical protein
MIVEDYGEPSAVNPTPDRYTAGFAAFEPDCRTFATAASHPVQQGNFVVMDRP